MPIFDPDTLDRLSKKPPRKAFEEVKSAIYQSGPVSSEDFRSAFEELVNSGLLTWEQIDQYEQD
jgi:hypothetical protein